MVCLVLPKGRREVDYTLCVRSNEEHCMPTSRNKQNINYNVFYCKITNIVHTGTYVRIKQGDNTCNILYTNFEMSESKTVVA